MKDTDTHVDTLHVQAPEEAARQVRLRLSTTLGGADLHPPALAPSQVLLVRELNDPEPGGLRLGNTGAVLDRTWERAVRDALDDSLHRAVHPTNGRVPPGAEAILFRDEAEAWACWGRAQIAREPSAARPWWMQSLETSSDATPSSARRSPVVASVWRARPRLVPAMTAHLAAWGAAVDALQEMSESEAEDVLRAVCTAYDSPPPPKPEAPANRADEEDTTPLPASSGLDEQRETEGGFPEERKPEIPSVPSGDPPWTSFVEESAGARLADALAQESPGHQQLLGVALALRDGPVTVRAPAFQTAWQAWRQAVESQDRSDGGEDTTLQRPDGSKVEFDDLGERAHLSRQGDAISVDDLSPDGDHRAREEEAMPAGDGEEAPWEDAYTATDLGGVLYLVNVLGALDLPAAATTPPVGEHVGAWAVLEALARALLGPDDDALRSNDPLWRALATLDGRRPETPAGQALDDAEDSPRAFRMPPEWLDDVEPLIEGRWTVENDRLRMWTELGCVADLEAGDDPDVQAEAEWNRIPNTGPLQRAESSATMPRAHEPADCAPALARWAARTAPYVRDRLAAALDVDDREANWIADLFRTAGRLYTTDTHVDLVLPLDAARIDARAAGLDRSPGWWSAGGRVVRFHFREADA